jgi:hypothetical protein
MISVTRDRATARVIERSIFRGIITGTIDADRRAI